MRIIFATFVFVLLSVAGAAQNAPTIMQQLYMVKSVFPDLKTVGILCHTRNASAALKEMNVAGTAYQIEVKVFHTETLQDVRESYDRLIQGSRIDLIWILPDGVTDQKFGRRFLSERCLVQKIPLYAYSADFVREGALLTVASGSDGSPQIVLNGKVAGLLGLAFSEEAKASMVSIE